MKTIAFLSIGRLVPLFLKDPAVVCSDHFLIASSMCWGHQSQTSSPLPAWAQML